MGMQAENCEATCPQTTRPQDDRLEATRRHGEDHHQAGEFAPPISVSLGFTATIQRLDGAHIGSFRNLLLGLDCKDRCQRFGHAVPDKVLSDYPETLLARGATLLGAFVERDLRGVLELHCMQDGRQAELAVLVKEGWRRCGIGWALVRSAIDCAQAQGVEEITLQFSRQNWPMRQLAQKADANFDLVFDEISAVVPVNRPARAPLPQSSFDPEPWSI